MKKVRAWRFYEKDKRRDWSAETEIGGLDSLSERLFQSDKEIVLVLRFFVLLVFLLFLLFFCLYLFLFLFFFFLFFLFLFFFFLFFFLFFFFFFFSSSSFSSSSSFFWKTLFEKNMPKGWHNDNTQIDEGKGKTHNPEAN